MKKSLLLIAILILFMGINVNAYTGWKTVRGKTYYYQNNKKVRGYHTIKGKLYYFYKSDATLRRGWQKDRDYLYYSDKNGVVKIGWQTIKGKRYYFNTQSPYKAYKGYHVINGKLYYFYMGNAALRKGWHKTKNNIYFSDGNGIVQTGWKTIEGSRYYFKESYPYQAFRGFHTIDNNLYYFYTDTGKLRIGFQKTKTNTYYSNSQGIVQRGWTEINNSKYYFNETHPYKAARGIKVFDDKQLVFNEQGKLVTGKNIIFGNEYYSNEEGEFIKINYIPKYYMQKDKRWNKKKYGKYEFGKTGCSPTSMAMAFQSIKQIELYPSTIARYLYDNTNQFNRRMAGTSGKGIIYASQHYNVKVVPMKSINDMKQYLEDGYILYAAMQNGKFATKDWNHAIILYRLKDNQTYALDPLLKSNNGYVDLSFIWKQKSTDKDDLTGGSAIYALLPNN